MPQHLVNKEGSPDFRTRRWSLTHLQGPFAAYGKYDEWATILQNVQQMRRYIDLAPDFGINGIELTGRPGEGGIDLDWLVSYRHMKAISRCGEDGDQISRRQKVVRYLADCCSQRGLETWLWHHELYLPAGFTDSYPEVRGDHYPVCLSHPLLGELVAAKINELFDAIPNVTGLVLSLCECWGLEITTDVGCRCNRCRGLSAVQRLRCAVNWVLDPLRRLGKKLVVRTFTHARYREVGQHTESRLMLQALRDLPKDVILMSKYCPQDFFGTAYPDDLLIGAFTNPHLVEFTLNRETMGGTWTLNLTPNDFKARFGHARECGCLGVVGRVDSAIHYDDPWLTIDHPNAFNIFCFSQLAWHADTDVDELWRRWLSYRYPGGDQSTLRRVLEPAEQVAQKIFFTFGGYGLNYANRIPHVNQAQIAFTFLSRAKWQPEWAAFHQRIAAGDPQLIDEAVAEKNEALEQISVSRQALRELSAALAPLDFIQLDALLERTQWAGRIWRGLTEVYFTSLSVSAGNTANVARLVCAAADLLMTARELRRLWGNQTWPVDATTFRGVHVEQFVCEALRPTLYQFLGESLPQTSVAGHGDIVHTYDLWGDNDIENLWRTLLRLMPIHNSHGRAVQSITVGPPLHRVAFETHAVVLLNSHNTLRLPVSSALCGPELSLGTHELELTFREKGIDLQCQSSKQ